MSVIGTSKKFALIVKKISVSITAATMPIQIRCFTLFPVMYAYNFLIVTTLPIVNHTLNYCLGRFIPSFLVLGEIVDFGVIFLVVVLDGI